MLICGSHLFPFLVFPAIFFLAFWLVVTQFLHIIEPC